MLFVMVRVFQLSEHDQLMHAKVLKNFEVSSTGVDLLGKKTNATIIITNSIIILHNEALFFRCTGFKIACAFMLKLGSYCVYFIQFYSSIGRWSNFHAWTTLMFIHLDQSIA